MAPICPQARCHAHLVLTDGPHGVFWGCPRFPHCRDSRPYAGEASSYLELHAALTAREAVIPATG